MNQADKPVPDQTPRCHAPGYFYSVGQSLARSLSHSLLLTLVTSLCLFYTLPLSAQIEQDYSRASSAYQSASFVLAEQLWGQLAVSGDANAQYALGIMHLKKEAQNANDKVAFSYFVSAAKQQHVGAIFNLGVAYWEGRGVNRHPAKALNWWEIAAQRQDAGAQYNLGLGYHIGVGREQNDQKALYWIQQSADNGHPQAKSLLSSLKVEDETEPTLASTEPGRTSKLDLDPDLIPESDSTASAPVANPQVVPPAPSGPKSTTEKKAVPAMLDTRINTEPTKPIAETAVAEEPVSKQVAAPAIIASTPAATTTVAKADKPVSTQKKSSAGTHSLKTSRLTQLRAAPSASAVSIASIKANSPVHMLQSTKNWSRVLVADAFPVWVYETFVLDQGEGKGNIKGNHVNIRPQPSTDNKSSPALGQLNEGDPVDIVLKRAPWVQIIPAQAFPAWIASEDIE